MRDSFLKIILSIFSLLISIIFLVVILNYYLKFFYKGDISHSSKWRFDTLEFRLDMVFWAKSWCDFSGEGCNSPENHFLSFPVRTFYPEGFSNESSICKKILFLGDSFTISPWVLSEDSYPSVFSKIYAENNSICVSSYIIAAGGANNSQELMFFNKVIGQINPDLVLWQFYWNDEIENVKEEILFVDENGLLKSRNQWNNMLFISGFLNQKIPFLMGSSLGEYLMMIGENDDPFSFWKFDFNNLEKSTNYNQKLIPSLLSKMDEYSKEYGFEWYSVLAPLECELVSGFSDCSSRIFSQSDLEKILRNNSLYLGLNLVNSSLDIDEQDLLLGWDLDENNILLFNTENDSTEFGSRHLSKKGNLLFGNILYKNFNYYNN